MSVVHYFIGCLIRWRMGTQLHLKNFLLNMQSRGRDDQLIHFQEAVHYIVWIPLVKDVLHFHDF